MTDPTERLEYFATNDTAHGGDCETPADIIEADDYPLLPETMEREFATPDPICTCGHSRSSHSEEMPYECFGPNCYCMGFTYPSKPDSAMQDVFAYLRAVKRFGLALQQLGRRCDE
jgi:hypothetical protein